MLYIAAYTICSIQKATRINAHELFCARGNGINGSVCFFQSHLIVTINKLLEFCKVGISSVLSLDEHLSQTNSVPVPDFVPSWCVVVLFGTSSSGHAVRNCSQRAANDFDAKQCSSTNTHSAYEYITHASAQLQAE
jgi:hypothetical protein